MNATRRAARDQAQSLGIELPSRLAWIGATTVGYALGVTFGGALAGGAARPLGSVLWGLLNVLLNGAVIGMSLGVAQFAVMPQPRVPLQAWVPATVTGAAIGFAVASVVAEALANRIDPYTNLVLAGTIIEQAAGAVIGLGLGLAQWWVLRRRLERGGVWIAASIVGIMLGTGIAALLIFELPALEDLASPVVGASLGLMTGIFQALVLRAAHKQ